jgi:hypothetical protein
VKALGHSSTGDHRRRFAWALAGEVLACALPPLACVPHAEPVAAPTAAPLAAPTPPAGPLGCPQEITLASAPFGDKDLGDRTSAVLHFLPQCPAGLQFLATGVHASLQHGAAAGLHMAVVLTQVGPGGSQASYRVHYNSTDNDALVHALRLPAAQLFSGELHVDVSSFSEGTEMVAGVTGYCGTPVPTSITLK